jgi:hypothetical protein
LYYQSSYAASDIIPLRLTLTSEQREALDVFAVSNVIDVRLQKVMVFGEQAAAVHPSILNNSNSFHRTDLAARSSRWQLDGRTREHLPDGEHPRPRWSIELKGNFHRETGVELTPSFDEPGMSLVVGRLAFGEGLILTDECPSIVLRVPLCVPHERIPSCDQPEKGASYGQDPVDCTKPLYKLIPPLLPCNATFLDSHVLYSAYTAFDSSPIL